MEARFFSTADSDRWDEFCRDAYNSTFLHTRRFLSYHGERFQDRSVVILEDESWVGVMPAAVSQADPSAVITHPGSTYGGIVHGGRLRGSRMLEAVMATRNLLESSGYRTLRYKAIPHIYHRSPADDDLYALFRLNARLYRCDLSCCVDLATRLPLSERRRRALRKARSSALNIAGGRAHLASVWHLLRENLQRKHAVQPTHSIGELTLLSERFPQEIQFRVACIGDRVVAGIVLFNCGLTAHAQYIAVSELGQDVHALDLLFEHCIDEARSAGRRYFDFGISTEDDGRALNDGLYRFKSEFGASGLVHSFYELQTGDATS